MKRQLITFIATLAVLALIVSLFGAGTPITRTTKTFIGGERLTFTATLDSVAHDTSYNFTAGKYDNVNWSTYPFFYQIAASTTGDSVNVTTYIDGSFDGVNNWTAVDTIAAITNETTATGTMDFNGIKRPYYRLRQKDLAKVENDTTTTVTTMLWMYQEY